MYRLFRRPERIWVGLREDRRRRCVLRTCGMSLIGPNDMVWCWSCRPFIVDVYRKIPDETSLFFEYMVTDIWSHIWVPIYDFKYMITSIWFQVYDYKYMISRIWFFACIWFHVYDFCTYMISRVWFCTYMICTYMILHVYDSKHMITSIWLQVYEYRHMIRRLYPYMGTHIWVPIYA